MTIASRFKAEGEVALRAPDAVLARIEAHLAEHGKVTRLRDACRLDHEFGTATALAGPRTLRVSIVSPDPTSLAYLQMGFTSHLREFAPDEAHGIVWSGANEAGKRPPYFREMRVVSARDVTPRMRRVRLAGENLERFTHGGLHVRLLLPPRRDVAPVWPILGADGDIAWPDEGERPAMRVYTIRHIDARAGLVDVDFVLHEGDHMPGAAWAAEASPGDVVGMTGPGGSGVGEADWYLLAGDETALPAIGRILEEMPAGRRVVALVDVADAAERQELRTRADLDLRWLERGGRPAGTTDLLAEAVRGIELPQGPRVFAWAACEFEAFKTIRGHFRKSLGLAREDHLAVAYWRRGAAGDEARSEARD
ncbi:siderophore-interacting protein [Lutibaculum baratangense]|uniref:Iron-chelator utilization protein n=1 Tax=Lutibaculum baratangense AMV1 TaxID=631454 RepID=V4TBE5_9HYPH|nr:siderophore-interacting protein [Lutibaculum baratangense]ESR23718.1 iron-chelator utilization protein [Lutibaculum baratangense AMV1]